ncbi:MAG TPA: SusC/RagA family TonB-linked outer membrane protein, partial [Bacteroidales bacterium]|nr:SusC/RagA family TonB-linked outer membrane protein [Bacteroidales bacterium]
GQYQKWSTAGFFGRLNYDYKGRYLLEANLRYDGTSRFRENKRWNLFPSFSAGWNIAREDFWAPLEEMVSTLKLRASYGELGNQNTDNWYPTYVTMPVKDTNGTWLIKGVKPTTSSAPSLISSSMTWERVNSWNIGLDMAFLRNRLTSSFDYYTRYTLDMIGPAPQLPDILGTDVPKTNNTDLKTYGFEFSLGWKDRLKNDLGYSVNLLLSDSQTEITRYPNKTGDLSTSTYREGQKMGEIWGYETVGIAKDQPEMDAHLAKLPNGGQDALGSQWSAGDIMYKDLNEDGKIDNGSNTEGNPGDLKIIGNSTARYLFSIDLNVDWKGFDARAFFQGVLKRDYFQDSYYFWGASSSGVWWSTGFKQHEDYYRNDASHPLGQNIDSYYPRPLFSDKNQKVQSRYLQDASYIRLKNLQFGYTLPQELTSKIRIDRLRVFVAGENLWTGTKMTKIFDPETISGGYGGNVYPLTKVFSVGLNVNF